MATGAKTGSGSVGVELRGALFHSDRYRRTKASLERQKAAASAYEPWQRGLLSMAGYWIDRADQEKEESRARLRLRRSREQKARRARRSGTPGVEHARPGRPPFALSARFVNAAVNCRRDFGVTFSEVAAFVIRHLAPRLPQGLRRKLTTGRGTVDEQIVRFAARLRRASSRKAS